MLKKFFLLRIILKKINEVKNLLKNEELFLFWFTLLFYFSLFFNINNKTLIISFLIYSIIIFIKFRNIEDSLFLSFVSSLPFMVGKTYNFILIPAEKIYQAIHPFGYVVNFSLNISNLFALVMFIFFLKNVFQHKENKNKPFSLIEITVVVLLVSLIIISSFLSSNPSLSFLFSIQFLIGPFIYIYSKTVFGWNGENQKRFILILITQIIFQSILVFLQFLHNGSLGRSIEFSQEITRFGRGADEDVFKYRPVGTFDHANYVAGFLVPRIVIIFTSLFNIQFENYRKYLLTSILLGLIAVAITLSRSAWLSGLVAFMLSIYFLEKIKKINLIKYFKTKLLLFAFILTPVIFIFIMPRLILSFDIFSTTGGYTTRTELAKEAIEILKQKFVFGVGFKMSVPEMFNNNPNGILYYFPAPAHNWYLNFAVENGIPALLIFILGINSVFRRIILLKNKPIFIYGVISSVLAILINCFFQPSLCGTEFLFILLSILSYAKNS